MGPPLRPAVEPMEVGTSLPSEMAAMRVIDSLQRYRETGPDGLLSSFTKDSSEVLVSGLTKLLGSFWERGEIPKD